jgi:predicted amino acid racemase
LVGRDRSAVGNRVNATLPPDYAIDYYGILDPDPSRPIEPGDTVIFGFRQQVFVTRALVVPISGITQGKPHVEGIWTAMGTPWLGNSIAKGEQ